MSISIYLTPNKLLIGIHVCGLSVVTIMVTKKPWTNTASGSVTILFSVAMYKGDDTQDGFTLKITKLVSTIVTNRPCIPVAQINGFSGMTYIQIDIHMHILLRYSLW